MFKTISIYDTTVQRPAAVVVNDTAPFVPVLLKQVGNASIRNEVASRVHGRHLSLQNQPRARPQGKKKAEKKGVKMPRLRPESWRLPVNETKFETYVPLHRLWLGYISELLGLGPQPSGTVTEQNAAMPNVPTIHAKLVKADFHGSILTVRQSKNPCLVGLSGIVIYESENAFRVITRGNKLKMLPKQSTVFTFGLPLYSATAGDGGRTVSDGPHVELELYGNQFEFRSSDRASRKFKHKGNIVL
ncbi:RNase P/MRP, p29 subunit [Thelephora terrestris]|uniref:RNase P/MRP, p29 subunit n=1 Tax=Thelephora terrestris TaxID=56493 RepID=A0A9P6HPK7_9AGAM|nr:RNase P/MRP, p29 subunit [Thelephora terrestris]